MLGGPEGETGAQRAPQAECMCHILNIYTDYMCQMYIRDTHLLGLGALWGPLVYPSSPRQACFPPSGEMGGCPSIFSSPEGARHLLKPWTDWWREGRRVCRARQDSSPPALVRVPPLSAEDTLGQMTRPSASSSVAISKGPHGASSRTRLHPKYQGRGRAAFASSLVTPRNHSTLNSPTHTVHA